MLGFINVNKPSGMSSSNVVVKIRKSYNIKKVGHMGTLDPMAEGVLPIAIGKATRMFDYFLDKYKSYRATFQFGMLTDTLDSTGIVVDTTNNIPTLEMLQEVIGRFVGKFAQIPPVFSAKLVNGVRAYKLARNGETPELKPKNIEITKMEILSYIDGLLTVDITCSSGTYIRAIGRDIAKELNTFCTMTALTRTQSGIFDIDNSFTIDEIVQAEDKSCFITPIEDVFPHLAKIELSDEEFDRLRNGLSIMDRWNIEGYVFAKLDGNLLGVAEKVDGEIKLKTYLME